MRFTRTLCLPSNTENPHQPSDFDRLKLIHIAGTKGKGSTSALISSIISQYLPSVSESIPQSPSSTSATTSIPRPLKIGLYTSPHLRFVRERIKVNNDALSETLFTKYFFETWDRLEASALSSGHPDPTSKSTKPVYFRFLTLMAFHTFMREGVDTAVIECGIGGEFDSTNIIQHPTVVGITSLGIDHVAMLGDTVEEIAWHKAGIMKSGSFSGKAYTVAQPGGAGRVLEERAREKGTELTVVGRHKQLQSREVKLGLDGDFQIGNASLAVEIAAEHLRCTGMVPRITTKCLPKEFVKGLEQVKWGGRCETRYEAIPGVEGTREIAWHLDGAHTLESIEVAAEWFADVINSTSPPLTTTPSTINHPPRILIFNQQTRNATALLSHLHALLSNLINPNNSSNEIHPTPQLIQAKGPFTHALFTTNTTHVSPKHSSPDLISMNTNKTDIEDLAVQTTLAHKWQDLEAGIQSSTASPSPSIRHSNPEPQTTNKYGFGVANGNGNAQKCTTEIFKTIEEAITRARQIARNHDCETKDAEREKVVVDGAKSNDDDNDDDDGQEEITRILVTGSVHLIGGVMEVLESEMELKR